jgi:hypothetical protein
VAGIPFLATAVSFGPPVGRIVISAQLMLRLRVSEYGIAILA